MDCTAGGNPDTTTAAAGRGDTREKLQLIGTTEERGGGGGLRNGVMDLEEDGIGVADLPSDGGQGDLGVGERAHREVVAL